LKTPSDGGVERLKNSTTDLTEGGDRINAVAVHVFVVASDDASFFWADPELVGAAGTGCVGPVIGRCCVA
jgi:hypothetical protein